MSTVYETRTYTFYVGKVPEAVRLYLEIGFPWMQRRGYDKNLVGFFQSDTGVSNQFIHIWKFESDAARRAHWALVAADPEYLEQLAPKLRPLIMSQEVKLMLPLPWGSHP